MTHGKVFSLGRQGETLLPFFDKTDPNSLINMVPESFQQAMLQVNPKFLRAGDTTLESWVKPNDTETRLRIAFWDEYFQAKDAGRAMVIPNVYVGICQKEYWYKYLLPRPHKVAWIITPPPEYTISMREIHDIGIRRMREVLQLPIKSKKGEPNTKLIGEMVKIFALIDNRVKGAVIQRLQVDQKTVNLHATIPERALTVGEVEREILEIENKIKALSSVNTNAMSMDEIKNARTVTEKGIDFLEAEAVAVKAAGTQE
jgi:hypothetical protein